MGTEVQFRMYFPRHHTMNNLNDKSSNKQSNGFSRTQTTPTMDVLLGHEKEQMKQTILNQESMFRHQLHELHRLSKTQRKLMLEIKSKGSRDLDCLAEQATRSGSNVFFSQSSCSSRTEPWRIFGVEISERDSRGSSAVTSRDNFLLSNLGTKEVGASLGDKFQQFVQDSSSTTRSPGGRFGCDFANDSAVDEKLKAEEASGERNHFDLNVSPIEEELAMDTDSEASIVETDPSEDELAAEALVSISLSKMELKKSEDPLRRFTEVISSSELEIGNIAHERMDYFELMTLSLEETCGSDVPKNRSELGEEHVSSRRGRQRMKDFQRDVLPRLTSLSRTEVAEDIHRIEGLMIADVALQRNAGAKGGKMRAKRHCGGGIDGVARWGRRARRTSCSAS